MATRAKARGPEAKTKSFECIEDIVLKLSEILRPPERLSVSETAAKYRKLNNPGAYVGPWKHSSAPYLVEPMDMLDSHEHDGEVFVGPAQSGKPIWIETPVATPSGWKRFGDIQPGDVVFSEHGEPVRVTYATKTFTNRDCFRIVFDDGTEIIADGVHRWAVNDQWAPNPYALTVKDTNQLHESYRITTSKGKHRYRYSIPVAAPLQLPDVELPIDPYVLGLWLGDGSHGNGALTIGLKDAQEIVTQIQARGFNASLLAANSRGTAVRALLTRKDGTSLTTLIRENGLKKCKHIPAAYLRASEHQRRELLRGMMDTDGTVAHNGRCQISQSRADLFAQTRELVTSLGYKPMCDVKDTTYRYNGELREGAVSYRLSFNTEDSTGCFTLDRQIARHRTHVAAKKTRPTHSGRRFIRLIEPAQSVPVRCISVENSSHLFLIGEQMVPTHNTDALILNWAAHSIKSDPMDMIIYSPTSAAARDFSQRRIDRLHRHSEDIGKMLSKARDSDNRLDKHYLSGTMLTLSHPSVTELAGKPVPRVAITDYDRIDDDIDGDGSCYDLASKRTTTFGSYAMTLAESSPSKPLEDPKWIARTAHEAPPAKGIFALYNRGDRRRWYWPCPHCGSYFEGEFSQLWWDRSLPTDIEQADSVRMICPASGCLIEPADRFEMNLWGVWLKDGEAMTAEGRRIGMGQRTKIASFWLKGVAAAFTTWQKLVSSFIAAQREYELTGDEGALRKFHNTDLAEVYIPKGIESERLPEHLKARAEDLGEKVVPLGSRFLLATVDVQKNCFIAQVHAISPGTPCDIAIVDRFTIQKSKRLDHDGERLWVKPATYQEDWDLIIEEVMDKTYPLADGSGRRMAVKLTLCDSGGKAGVTSNAYDFYRRLRELNLHGRFHLVKGDSKPGQVRTRISYPDATTKDKFSAARGDVPVLMLNSNTLKDALHGRLDSVTPGKGMIRYPDWLPDWFFMELCAEVRTPKGWAKTGVHVRNEAWDLLYYCLGGIASQLLLIEKIDWSAPPKWAAEWDENLMISAPGEAKRFAQQQNTEYDFAKFAEALA